MGFRSAWVLLPVSVSLGFIMSCATQASDAPAGGGGDTSSSGGTSASGGTSGAAGGSGGSVSSAGTNAGAGQSAGGVGNAGAGGANGAGAAGSAGTSSGAGAGAGGASGGASGAAGAGGTSGNAATGGAGGSSGAVGHAGSGGAGTGGTGGATAGTGGGGASSGGTGGSGGSGGAAGAGGGGGGSGGIVGKMYTLDTFVIGTSAASATVNVTWNASKIEFVFVVQDATPEDDSAVNWQDDASEIYLDLNNGKTGAFQPDDCEIVIPRLTGTVDGVGTVNFAAVTVQRTSNGATGYTLDVSVPWSALNIGAPPLGQTIGINLAVDDDTNGGDRDAQLMLSGDQFAYNKPSAWASLLLN